MDDNAARDIARHDYGEWTVRKILNHEIAGDTATVTSTTFTVLFTDSPIPLTGQRFRDLKLVPEFQSYIRDTRALRSLVDRLPKEPSGPGKRLTGRSKSLRTLLAAND